MTGVWFENQRPLTPIKCNAAGAGRRYSGMVASPLRSGRLDPPDVCLFYASPGQMILFINGLQYRNYRRYDFTITGKRVRRQLGTTLAA